MENCLTLYWKNGKVATTDGPYAETKEQLGGINILEARDMNHASKRSSITGGANWGSAWHQPYWRQFYSLSYLGLVRASTLAGDAAKTGKTFQDFLAMWKDADPDIPILIAAKAEYARLS